MSKSNVITFRISDELLTVLSLKATSANMSNSNYLRSVITNSEVKHKKKNEINNKLFVVNKISNNINQIAKRLNTDNKKGIINQNSYDKVLNELSIISDILKTEL